MGKINLNRLQGFSFEAENSLGFKTTLDGSVSIGGNDKGFRPMEMLLIGLGGCSAFDVLSILQKQRQNPTDFSITVDGERSDDIPSVYTNIHVIFSIAGEVSEKHAEKAIELSMEKYCSVAKMLGQMAKISWEFKLLG